jgi:hypothetical protein
LRYVPYNRSAIHRLPLNEKPIQSCFTSTVQNYLLLSNY